MARNRLWAKTLGPLELQWRFAAGECAEQVQCRSSPGVVMMIDAVFDHFLLLCAGLLPSQSIMGRREESRSATSADSHVSLSFFLQTA